MTKCNVKDVLTSQYARKIPHLLLNLSKITFPHECLLPTDFPKPAHPARSSD